MRKTVRDRLLVIAKAVEHWPTMQKDSAEVAISVSTPNGVVEYIVSKHIPAEDREAVRNALPLLMTDDFLVAAQSIRQATALWKEG